MVAEHKKPPKKAADSFFSGFWVRVLAFFIDALLIGTAGLIIGKVFYGFLIEISPYGRFLGFPVALLYFGIMNSSYGGGQTLGKRVAKIRVQNVDGSPLSPGRSFARAGLLFVPYFLNGAALPPSAAAIPAFAYLLSLLVFGMIGAIIYLLIFNRPSRRSLHDLAVQSVVVRVAAKKRQQIQPLWKGHAAIVGAILLVSLSFPLVVKGIVDDETLFNNLIALQQKAIDVPGVNYATANVGSDFQTSFVTGETVTSTYVTVRVFVGKNAPDFKILSAQIAQMVLDAYPPTAEKDRLIIIISRGYDIGIASWWTHANYLYSPAEWRSQIAETLDQEGET